MDYRYIQGECTYRCSRLRLGSWSSACSQETQPVINNTNKYILVPGLIVVWFVTYRGIRAFRGARGFVLTTLSTRSFWRVIDPSPVERTRPTERTNTSSAISLSAKSPNYNTWRWSNHRTPIALQVVPSLRTPLPSVVAFVNGPANSPRHFSLITAKLLGSDASLAAGLGGGGGRRDEQGNHNR